MIDQLKFFIFLFFFFNDTATTEIYTLSLHDALPISNGSLEIWRCENSRAKEWRDNRDRKSTRLNSSHSQISYAVFCLKKKKNIRLAISLHMQHEPTVHAMVLQVLVYDYPLS